MDKQGPAVYQFGEFQLDCGARKLTRGSEDLPLSPKEFQTLAILVEAENRAVDRELLIRTVWPDTIVGDTSLGRNISILRRHLGKDAIESLPRFGYRFVPQITELTPAPEAPESNPAPTPATTAPSFNPTAPAPPTSQPQTYKALPWAIIAAFILTIAAASTLLGLKRQHQLNSASSNQDKIAHAEPILLAVLPFQNTSANPAQTDYLRDGLADELTARLGALDYAYLRVLARSTTRQYINSTLQPAEIGQQIGARYLMEGSVRFEQGRAKVAVNLVDTHSQTILWSQVFNRPIDELSKEEDDIVDHLAISQALPEATQTWDATQHPEGGSPAAHDEYLQGRYEIALGNRDAFARALDHFQRAAILDPHYAKAFAGIAEAYIYRTDTLPLAFCYAKAHQATMTALQLDPTLGDAHRDLAYLQMNDARNLMAADAEFRRAVQLIPDDVRTRAWYSQMLTAQRKNQEAVKQASAAYQLDPRSPRTIANYGYILVQAGKVQEGVQILQSALQLDPDNEMAWGYLGTGYALLHRYPDAAAAFDRAASYDKSGKAYQADAAYARAQAGDPSQATQLLNTWQPMIQRHEWITSQAMAMVALARGDKAAAVDWLHRGIQDRSVELFELNTEPLYSAMKDHPEFPRLLAEAGAEQ